MTEIQVTSQKKIPQSAAFAVRTSPVAIAARETAFTIRPALGDSMIWTIQYSFLDRSGASHDVWDTSAVRVEGLAFAKGAIAIPAFMGTTGQSSYGRDSASIAVEGLSAVADTAITFDGFSRYDTTLVTLQSGTSSRYYFLDNVVSYENVVLMRGAGAPAYPVSGEVRIDVFASFLNSPRHLTTSDVREEFDAVMVIAFDHAQPQRPVVTIMANTESSTTTYTYRIDLKTGTIQR